ncbi:shikimate dehydrogenase [Euzebya sp.]|uniref:shikimate dehydrogenase family protein n=1 Tax=Euzebya sp. TaxID=1971409 RepID=UPI00351449EE
MTDAATRLLCVLGHPVGHSISPQLHSAAIAAAGLNAVYLAFDVAPEGFTAAIEGLVALGFLGANVTIPHKAAALAIAETATEEAEFIGAANTLYWDADGRLAADNTDAAGLMAVLGECGVTAGDPVTLFGAGGAARAAAVALGRIGAAVRVEARRADAAADVEALARRAGGQMADDDPPRVVVNATPLGRHGERLPEELMGLGEGQVALDLNYGPASPFLTEAGRRGAVAVDGIGMLVGQAEAAFARWTGQAPPEGVMWAAAAQVGP